MLVKNVFRNLSSRFVCIALVGASVLGACSPKGSDEASKGGVDGSGGNLRSIEYLSFKDFVENDQQLYLRDIIHRLALIQKNSPDDLGTSEGILQKFIGKNIEDIESLARTVHFHATNGECKSNNHPSADSAVTKEGVICVSHLAFMRFTNRDLVPKLMSLTFHELSHLRGFNEDEAVKLQLLLEDHGQIGKKVILANNEEYAGARKAIEKIGRRASFALDTILDNEADACISYGEAISLVEDFNSFSWSLPHYLVKQTADSVLRGLTGTRCNFKHKDEGRKQLVEILKNVAAIDRIFEQFESPMCTGNLCMRRRWLGTNNPEESILRTEAVGQDLDRHSNLPNTVVDKVECRLENLSDKLVTTMTFKEKENSLERITIKNFSFIDVSPDLFVPSIMQIRIWHDGFIQLLDADGFTSSGVSLAGFIQNGSKEKISIHFATMNANSRPTRDLDGHPEHSAGDTNYFQVDPTNSFGGVIAKTPTIEKEYLLTCGLNLR